MNLDLLIEIKKQGLKQFEVGHKAYIQPSRMSNIISGNSKPVTKDEKSRLAKALRTTIETIFPTKKEEK